MAKDPGWTITLSPLETKFKGFVPVWFKNAYPTFGNKGQAADMTNTSLLDPNVLSPGPAPTDLTKGDENGAVTTLIETILPIAVSSNVTYAAGTNLIYKLSNTAVTDDGTYPMTLDKAAVTGEDIDDIAYYKSNLYGAFNHSGSAGDIFKLTLSTDTLDADWGSTTPTGAATLQDAPHYFLQAGEDSLYITNGQYVAKMADDSTLDPIALDFWTNGQTVSLAWNNNRVYVAVNRPNVSGANFNQSGIYRWDGSASSWEGDPIEVSGRLGALYVKNGTTFVWWEDAPNSSYFNVGFVTGGRLEPIRKCKGTLPNHRQVGEYEGHLAWISDGLIYLYGAPSPLMNVELFQYASALHTNTTGAMATPFGDILVSSNDGSTQYSLAKLSGYTTSSTYKTKAYPVTMAGMKSEVDMIQVEYDALASGAQADFTLTYDKGGSSLTLDSISYTNDSGTTLKKIISEHEGPQVEDFRLDIDHSNGSASNPVTIRSILIKGHWIPNL